MVLGALIIGAAGAALVLSRRNMGGHGRAARGHRPSPAVALAVVTGLLYLNQVLSTVYVLRVQGGDPAFIARYLPDGWFALARGDAIETLARLFPAPGLLAPSVLRVPALLELPFVVFAYLTVCRWFSPGVYRRALRLAWPVAVSYTVTFGLIEWSLHNPYTVDDLVLRGVAAVVTPLCVARLDGDAPDGTHDLSGLLVFAVSTVALGAVVLVVYETALLYNLGHLAGRLPIVAVALVVLVVARIAARRVPARAPGRGVDAIGRSFGHLLVLFFVPALPIRYGLGFGAAYASAAATSVLVMAAVVPGVREAYARRPGRPAVWAGQSALALAAGVCGAATAVLLPDGYAETRLLWAAAACFVSAVSVCALIDRVIGESGVLPSRTSSASRRTSWP